MRDMKVLAWNVTGGHDSKRISRGQWLHSFIQLVGCSTAICCYYQVVLSHDLFVATSAASTPACLVLGHALALIPRRTSPPSHLVSHSFTHMVDTVCTLRSCSSLPVETSHRIRASDLGSSFFLPVLGITLSGPFNTKHKDDFCCFRLFT
ncbi:hypothetical protein B0J15DRAFT_131473 [Fusarium solani]|jgi:hypothetical protein|uniref:Uncharacterized protein n=1 Tax=Fusarium solani TaxID=169388 RepID=A0A9P9L592_FUSSL|nr:uncharacterized protein B0J15DRAFT_131473 [Fusarium solani]KAH7274483.1 hypothetical protein B0J15DRAFT_131473 [Fusarium solani]